MSSWRDAEDPRCPECGEKISATASYCMHCHADLPGDTDEGYEDTGEDTILSDEDIEAAAGDGPDVEDGTDDSDETGDSSLLGWIFSSDDSGSSNTHTTSTESTTATSDEKRNRVDGLAGRVVSMLGTDVPEPEGVPDDAFKASLAVRIPAALFLGLSVSAVVLGVAGEVFAHLPGELLDTLDIIALIVIIAWLARKPLVSDIVGDAAYAIALTLLAWPLLAAGTDLARLAIDSGSVERSANQIVLQAVGMQIGMVFVASFFLVIGFVGNRWARSKLDSIAESAEQNASA